MKRYFAVLAVVAVFVLLSFRGILFAPGHVYQNWDNATPPHAREVRNLASISRHAWHPLFEMGSPGVFGSINRWYDLIARESLAPIGGDVLAKWLPSVMALAGAGGALWLCAMLGLGFWPSVAAALLWSANPRMYSLTVSGHIFELGFALALLPWTMGLLHAATTTCRTLLRLALALAGGLLGALVCSASPYGIVFFSVMFTLWALSETLAGRGSKTLGVMALSGTVILVLSLHWIVPAGLSMAKSDSGIKFHQTASELDANYRGMYRDFSVPLRQAMIGHSDNYGMGTEYAYPKNIRENPWWTASALGLFGLALLGCVCRAKAPGLKIFAGLCLFFGFILFAGNKTPLGALLYERVLARVPMVFFLMARPARWLPLYYAGLSLLAGMGVQVLLDASGKHRPRLRSVMTLAAFALLAVYLEPYWSGSIATPKNATTQTMALMPQPIDPNEGRLAEFFSTDPDDYRLTVWPTIAGPTGRVPEPPINAVTRNFGFLGKDAVIGPSFAGEPFSRFLLTALHRRDPATDRFGRLLGLAAVRRVVFDRDVPYLSYSSFGWMAPTKRGPETLFDPDDVLARFLAVQTDLTPDRDLDFGPFEIWDNRDFLPRLRLSGRSLLASGGAPLLLSLAALEPDLSADAALFMATDVSPIELDRVQDLTGTGREQGAWGGLVQHGAAAPELLLPWLDPKSWLPAASAVVASGKTERLSGLAATSPWFDGSPLNAGGVVTAGPAELLFALPGPGPARVFVRHGQTTFAGGLDIAVDGQGRSRLDPAGALEKGLTWTDLGRVEPDHGREAVISLRASGRGVVVAGLLAIPEASFQAAVGALARRAEAGVLVAAEAEQAVPGPARPLARTVDLPLLAPSPDVDIATAGPLRIETDASGAGYVAAEGPDEAEIAFTVRFPEAPEAVTLECFPRLFGDKDAPSFVQADVSMGGRDLRPLFRLEGRPDGRWEDVYGRTETHRLPDPGRELTVRLRLRQAQLSSQANAPNLPMRLTATFALPGGATPSFGQAVRLPAAFDLLAPRPGAYRLAVRVIGRAGDRLSPSAGPDRTLDRDGAAWLDLGRVETGPDGRTSLRLDGPPSAACDLLTLAASGAGPTGRTDGAGSADRAAAPAPDGALAGSPPPLAYQRVNPGRYLLDIPADPPALLLFSESWHPAWELRAAGRTAAPVKAYGFQSAFPLGPEDAGPAELVFRYQDIQERILAVTEPAWIAAILAVAGLLAAEAVSRRRAGH